MISRLRLNEVHLSSTVEGDPVCHLYMSEIFLKWTKYKRTSQCCQCSIYRHALINSDLKNDIKMILLHERLDMDMYIHLNMKS